MAVLSFGNDKHGTIRNLLVKLSAPLFSLAFAGAASAQELNYNYIEVSWVFADELQTDVVDAVTGGAADVDTGAWFEGSGEFFPNAFLRIAGSSLKMDTEAEFGNTGLSTFSVGVGGYLPLQKFFGNMQQAFNLTEQLALTGDWQMLDLELGDGDFELNTFRVGARWYF